MNYYKIILLILILYFVLNNTSENLNIFHRGGRWNCLNIDVVKNCLGKCWNPWNKTECNNCKIQFRAGCYCLYDGRC